MENGRLPNISWMQFVLDEQQRVVEIIHPDDALFFGRRPEQGATLTGAAGETNRDQAAVITDGVCRAQQQHRNSCFEYFSDCGDGRGTYVCAYAEYRPDGTVCLCLNSLDGGGMHRAAEASGQESGALLQTMYENLPVGLEVYDRDGRLIEINAYGLKIMGVDDKNDILGVGLFDNPGLTGEARARLLAGENLHITTDYDFSRVGECFKTSKRSVSHLEVSISVMRNSAGLIDKYLVIVQDMTEFVRLQSSYGRLYDQSLTILNSLPVGVGIYAKDGSLLYANDMMGSIFGVDLQPMRDKPVNLNENRLLPAELMDAFRNGTPVHVHFPYDFNTVAESGYLVSAHTQTREIDCNGLPVFDSAGNLDRYILTITDVTEAARKEEQLRRSKKKNELAMQASDIMLWEFSVGKKLFYSDNEPMNGYDNTKPLTIADYTDSIHPDDREPVFGVLDRMCAGEDFSFRFEARIQFPDTSEWQYCAVSGSPYEKAPDGTVVRYVGMRKNDSVLQRKKLLQENILNSIPVSVHIKDVENDFRYVFCNEESKRMFGTSEEKTLYDVMEAGEVGRIRKTDLEVFKTETPYFGQERVILHDGRRYDVLVRKSVIYDNGNRLLLSVRWDQSMQNELTRQAKLLSVTLEAMSAYTWFYEPDEMRISFGDGFDKMGRSASEVNTHQKFITCIHPDDVPVFVNSLEAVVAKDSGVWEVECRFDLDGDGVYSWWESRGVLETTVLNDVPYKYMFGMTINIDSHKQAELTLLRNKEEMVHLIRQNELVLDNANAGLAYITPDYVVQWENVSKCSASLSYEAYKRGEVCYKSAHGRTTPCENCVLQRTFQSRQVEQIKFAFESGRTVEVIATPVLRDDGEVDGIVIRVEDITEREQMFHELEQAKALAEQSDKLKSAFLANMSHEIRTPLNAIVGFSELLMESTEEDRGDFMQIIKNNNELLLKLINDILDLSKIEAGSVELQYEDFDLSEYFEEVAVSMRQRLTKPEVQLIAANPYRSCRVRLDKNRIAQILINYVTNAIKYTPGGFIEMGYGCTDTGIRLYVRDSGIGIPDEKKPRVFHRFAKLDEFAQGTGLGLSICKAIVESMGGRVGFESTEGKGSLFWAELPCDPEVGAVAGQGIDALSGAVTPDSAASGATKNTGINAVPARRTILVAEDILSNFLLVSAILRRDFDLVHAHNGQQAVELARDRRFDLLLMDMKMPVMDGLTATAEIRKFDTGLPIVALTAHAFEADKVAALAAGCNDFLVKPVSRAQLMAVTRKYCPGAEDMEGGA